jgi:lipopolysaccharide export system protein LptA
MYKPLTKILNKSLISFSLAWCVMFSSLAEKFDISQDININSSRQAADLKNKIFSYIDNVLITQGPLVIKADLVQVTTDNDKIYLAKGNPATFKHILNDGTPIFLQANTIKYQPSKSIIIFSGDAEFRQEGSKVQGSIITYNFLTEQVNASSDGNDNNDRVSTTLQSKVLDKKK